MDRIINSKKNCNYRVDEINNGIKKSRLGWIGQVMQMRPRRIPKKMLNTKIEGERPTGGPKTTWIDQVRKDIEIRGGN